MTERAPDFRVTNESRTSGPDIIDRAGAAMKGAYEYIRGQRSPTFDELDSSHRTLALASAMVAAEPLLDALRDIAAMRTPSANATVKRMADRAEDALAIVPAPSHKGGNRNGG